MMPLLVATSMLVTTAHSSKPFTAIYTDICFTKLFLFFFPGRSSGRPSTLATLLTLLPGITGPPGPPGPGPPGPPGTATRKCASYSLHSNKIKEFISKSFQYCMYACALPVHSRKLTLITRITYNYARAGRPASAYYIYLCQAVVAYLVILQRQPARTNVGLSGPHPRRMYTTNPSHSAIVTHPLILAEMSGTCAAARNAHSLQTDACASCLPLVNKLQLWLQRPATDSMVWMRLWQR